MTIYKGLAGLKAAADAQLLADIRVTPEMKTKLVTHIRTLEQLGIPASGQQASTRSGSRPRRGVTAAAWSLAVVGVVALAVIVGNQSPGAVFPGPEVAPAKLSMKLADSNVSSAQNIKITTLYANTRGAGTGDSVGDEYGAVSHSEGVAAEVQPGRKIILNGDYGLRVKNARVAVERLRTLAAAAEGYVAEATLNRDADGAWSGRVVLRIPAARFTAALAEVSQIGEVEHERQWSQDVTDQFMDLEHRTAILKEHEQRLRDLAAKAATFDDWNKLTTQLNETRTQIENITGKLKLLANQTDYAILTVQVWQSSPDELQTLSGATTLPTQLWQAFVNSALRLTNMARRAIVGLAALTPFGLAALVPAGLVLIYWRRRQAG